METSARTSDSSSTPEDIIFKSLYDAQMRTALKARKSVLEFFEYEEPKEKLDNIDQLLDKEQKEEQAALGGNDPSASSSTQNQPSTMAMEVSGTEHITQTFVAAGLGSESDDVQKFVDMVRTKVANQCTFIDQSAHSEDALMNELCQDSPFSFGPYLS
eukprot:5671868-Amphidinium_carterae.1